MAAAAGRATCRDVIRRSEVAAGRVRLRGFLSGGERRERARVSSAKNGRGGQIYRFWELGESK